MLDNLNGRPQDPDVSACLTEVCQNLVTIMKELLSDQGTVMKKWSTILTDDETVEIGGSELKLKISECLVSLSKVEEVERSVMVGDNDKALHQIAEILAKIGFITKNIQMGKQIYLQ